MGDNNRGHTFGTLVWAVAVVCACARPAAGHMCVHDEPWLQEATRKMQELNENSAIQAEPQSASVFEPIRIQTIETYFTTTHYCVSAGEAKPNFKGTGTTEVCEEDDVITEAKLTLFRTLMTKATERIQKFLNVKDLGTINANQDCAQSGYDINTPVSAGHADFLVFLSVGPVSNDETVAFATSCAYYSNGRPSIGYVNFNPIWLVSDDLEPSFKMEQLIITTVHELLHALGLSATFFARQSSFEEVIAIRDKTGITVLNVPGIVAFLKTHLGCTKDFKPELEDEGTTGSVGSHWDARMAREDIMTASSGTKLSNITLLYFNHFAFYDVDFSAAEELLVGKGSGCEFMENKCLPLKANTKDWCDGPLTPVQTGCTLDKKSFGRCNVALADADLPTYFRYYTNPRHGGRTYVDRCPYIEEYNNGRCSFAKTPEESDSIRGNFYGVGGRCFEVDSLQLPNYKPIDGQRCLQARCHAEGSRLELKIGSSWVACALDGSAGTVDAVGGYNGTVNCPAASEMCDEVLNNLEVDLIENGGYLLVIQLNFTGTQWNELVKESDKLQLVIDALRSDLEDRLKVDRDLISVFRNFPDDSGMSFSVGVLNTGATAVSEEQAVAEVQKVVGTTGEFSMMEASYAAQTSDSSDISVRTVEGLRASPESLCPFDISADRCVVLIGLGTTALLAILFALAMYFLCLRSPFDTPPIPLGMKKY